MPENSDESVLARFNSYDNIERVLIALLSFEDVNMTRSSAHTELDSFYKKILEKFDNEYSMFYECLGLKVNNHVVRFRKQPEDPPHNAARAAIERLRIYSEWYRSPTRSRPWRAHLYGARVKYPFDVYDFAKWYTPVLRALVEALSICMERAPTFSVANEGDAASTTGPIKCMHVPSTTSSELDDSILDSDISGPQYTEQWDYAQSPPESIRAASQWPSPEPIKPESTKEALGQRKVNALQLMTALKVDEKISVQARASDFPKSSLATDPAPPKLTAMKYFVANPTDSRPKGGNLPATSSSLRRELANERASREVEKHGHIAQITKLSRQLTYAQERSQMLFEELDTAKASKAGLQKTLKEVADAREDAEWGKYIAQNKLGLTSKKNEALQKDVEKVREEGRNDIRAQVSAVLSGILTPSLR